MAKILPVASGKGGVGKTFFVTNLSIMLAERCSKVVAIDLDLGGSNLHTMLGIKNDLPGLGHFINNRITNFSELIHKTEYTNLYFVPGDALFVGTANISFSKKKKILSEISKIDADWVILDLASGSSNNIVDFFLISNCGILITTPELTSVLNLYSFLKNAFYRYILQGFSKKESVKQKIIEAASLRLEKDDLRFKDYIEILKKDFSEYKERIENLVNNFFPKLVLNMGNNERDISFGENLRNIISKNLGLDIEYLGLLPEESAARNFVIARKPLCKSGISSKWVENCAKIVQRLLEFHNYPVTIFSEDIDSLDVIYEDMENILK
ncbi:MAG TPA: P-loop NTPase [Spirochaetota bacterium]|nr:P-loop NTPase [Spirochaetota bacterium]HOL56217.1 P-loop NTPase [Spirochaetota bacterium]HPP03810.1 P-loop NTPase [Spirochaetota bacterium]